MSRAETINRINQLTRLRNALFGLSQVMDDEDLIRLRSRLECLNQLDKYPAGLPETLEWFNVQLEHRKIHPEDANPWLKAQLERIKEEELE